MTKKSVAHPKVATKPAKASVKTSPPKKPAPKKTAAKRTINLALQGGGAHGAYTWGVLDRLLEEEDLHIDGISGTSAGAMNGAVLVNGFMEGGYAGARAALDNFWKEISSLGQIFNPAQQNPFEHYHHGWNLDWSMSYNLFDIMSRSFSPYQLNPLNLNPLRDLLERTLDIPKVQSCSGIKLFVSATHVESGQSRVFKDKGISIDAILASACIPFLFQAVEIDNEPYWDGGYVGNPVLWPLIYQTESEDILLVQLNPLFREGTPKQAHDIINRLNEITFNSSLMAEVRAIDFVKKLIDQGKLSDEKYKDVHMHLISAPMAMRDFDASSKMNTQWGFFQVLKEAGRESTDAWLKKHGKHIGNHSTVDLWDTFLKPRNHPPRKVA